MDRQFLGAFSRNPAVFAPFDPAAYEPVNLARLEASLREVRALLNDPDMLERRVLALRNGTAKPIEGF